MEVLDSDTSQRGGAKAAYRAVKVKKLKRKALNQLLHQQADDTAQKGFSEQQHTGILWESSGTPQTTNRDHGTVEPLWTLAEQQNFY